MASSLTFWGMRYAQPSFLVPGAYPAHTQSLAAVLQDRERQRGGRVSEGERERERERQREKERERERE